MSGICGIAIHGRDRRLDPSDLMPMVQGLSASEDNDGFTIIPGPAALGAQSFQGRLAGVAGMTVQQKSLALVFHGNLFAMKDSLQTRVGEDPFHALLQFYLKEGMGFLRRLRGAFVLAIWDARDESLYLATDRFRVHPLFYFQDGEKLIFASRMKSILACPLAASRTINYEAILHVVGSSIIPTPETIFREIRKVPAGHVLAWQQGEMKLKPYWEISFRTPSMDSEADLAKRLRKQFAEALSVSLESDGTSERIGTFLSGGVDSSTVTGVLTQLLNRPVKSFSIGFGVENFNEMEYARIAARAFGSDHHEYFVTPEDTCNAIQVLLNSIDEPYANASCVPSYYCAKLAREHGVDFLYAGDGGDELFAGNQRYAEQAVFEYYGRIPAALRRFILDPAVSAMAKTLPINVLVKGKKYIQKAGMPLYERVCSYGFFRIIPVTEFAEADFLAQIGHEHDPVERYRYYYENAPAETELDRHLYIDWMLTLADNDLVKVTRMTEAAGVAVRYPFLDKELVEFSVTVPSRTKMRGRELRSFFKNAYADLLPPEIRKKKKHGFGLPIPVWLRTDQRLNDLMHDLVLSPRSVQRGYFRRKALENLVELHKTDKSSFYGTVLWNLMILELWLRNTQTAGTN